MPWQQVFFASSSINPEGAEGLFLGNPLLFLTQLEAVLATIVYVFVVSFIILKITDLTVGLRVDAEAEFVGLDHAVRGESGYTA